jgi:flagellar basal-body rod modification protein FlgD
MINPSEVFGSKATPGDPQEAAKASNKLGKDEFLKLLMTQMGNQDPTAPNDSQAFVAQLATFAQLELQENGNKTLDNLLLTQASSSQTAMAGFVGKDIVYKADSIQLIAGEKSAATAQLKDDATNVTAVILDSEGKAVRTMQLGGHQNGSMAFEWDGRDDNGRVMPPGSYGLRVTAQDVQGKSVAVEQRGAGHVDGIAYVDGVATLKLGDVKVKMSDIVEINERKQQP